MLWDKFSKNQVFSLKSCFFSEFRLIQSNFRSIEILCLKILWASAWFAWSNLFFRSIEHHVLAFLKRVLWLIQTFFSKVLFKLFFSLRLGKAALRFFCRFLPQFLLGFSFSRPVRPFYPSFWFYSHVFMHLKGIFKPL